MSSGTFNVSRRIWSHPAFAPSEYSEREAFLWLVSEASWKPRTVRAGRMVVDLERGQLCASVRFIADAWGWSKSRVDRFLKRLQTHGMIQSESGTGQLVITLCNYDEYQGQRDTSGTEAGQKRDRSGTNYKKDEIRDKKEYSDTNVSDGQAVDFAKAIFERGVAFLCRHGQTERNARALVGKWRKGREDREVFDAFAACHKAGVTDPVPWIEARLKPQQQADLDSIFAALKGEKE